jgi:succinyl-CoA synthetase beta subunit
VVKAQVYAGGRGKAGFVKLVRSADEARQAAQFMLTHRMVSYQTGPEGVPVNVLIVAPGVDIAKEYYLGITVDRGRNTSTLIASAEGGVEIEEVAKKSPEKVLKEPLHPLLGLQPFQARELAYKLGFRDKLAGEAAKLMANLAKVFLKYDASLAETKCDLIADALVKAGREVGFKIPVVVRLEGTNVEKAREILKAAHQELPTLITATDLTDAAKKVVAAVP